MDLLKNVKGVKLGQSVNDVKLNKELFDVSEGVVNHYREDIDKDISILLNKNIKCNYFIWTLRDGGTHLFQLDRLIVKDSYDNMCFNTLFSNVKGVIKPTSNIQECYLIQVFERKRKNVFGSITKLNKVDLKKIIDENTSVYSKVSICIEFTDGKHETYIVENTEHLFYTALRELNLSENSIKSFKIIEYLK